MLLCLTFFSCTRRNSPNAYIAKNIEDASLMRRVGSEFQIINVDGAIKVGMDSLISRLASVSYIPLESTDLIGAMDKVLVYNDNIYILDAYITEKVFIFDKQGCLLNTIDNKGGGPNEYSGLSGMCIDSIKKELCLNDRLSMDKLYYDLDGHFLRKEKGIPCFYINIFHPYVINQLSFGQSFSDDVNYHIVCTINDSIYCKGFPYAPIQKQYSISANAVYNSMGDLLFNPTLSDTIYHIKSFNEYSVRYIIQHKHSIWDKHQEVLSYEEISDLIRNSGYTALGSMFYETSKYIFFTINRKRDKFIAVKYLFFDKKQKQVYEMDNSYNKIYVEMILPDLIALDGEVCIASFDPYRIKEVVTNKGTYTIKNDTLEAIIKNSNENSNPVLVLYQLK